MSPNPAPPTSPPSDSDSPDHTVSTPEGDFALLTLRPLKVEEVVEYVSGTGVGATAVFVGTTRDNFNGKPVTHLEYEAFPPLALKSLKSILLEAREKFSRSNPAGAEAGSSRSATVWPVTSTQARPPPSSSSHSSSASLPSPPKTDPTQAAFHRLTIHHLLGPAPPLTPTLIIAVSSSHRREAFEVCEWALEEVKGRVEVWKREFYGVDGGGEEGEGRKVKGVWKENFAGVRRA